MKVLKQGQCVRHERFGIGIAAGSNEERTTIEFYEHGSKTFVTHMLEAELVAEAPPRPQGAELRPGRSAKKSRAAK